MKTHRIYFAHGSQVGHPLNVHAGATLTGDLPAGCVLRAGATLAELQPVVLPYTAPGEAVVRIDCDQFTAPVLAVVSIEEPA